MSFEGGYCLNKDVCLGVSTKSQVEAQYEIRVCYNVLYLFTVSPTYSASLYSSFEFDLDQVSSHPSLLCYVLLLFSVYLLDNECFFPSMTV